MKNHEIKPGMMVNYRTKSGRVGIATVKGFTDTTFGKCVILTFTNKSGKAVEFCKLLKNVWIGNQHEIDNQHKTNNQHNFAVGDMVWCALANTNPYEVRQVKLNEIRDNGKVIVGYGNGYWQPCHMSELYATEEECKAATPGEWHEGDKAYYVTALGQVATGTIVRRNLHVMYAAPDIYGLFLESDIEPYYYKRWACEPITQEKKKYRVCTCMPYGEYTRIYKTYEQCHATVPHIKQLSKQESIAVHEEFARKKEMPVLNHSYA